MIRNNYHLQSDWQLFFIFLYITSVFNNIWRVSYWIAIFTNLLTLSRHLMYKITYNDSTCLHSHIIFVAITIFQMFVLISYWWSRLLLYLRHTFPLPSEWFPFVFHRWIYPCTTLPNHIFSIEIFLDLILFTFTTDMCMSKCFHQNFHNFTCSILPTKNRVVACWPDAQVVSQWLL